MNDQVILYHYSYYRYSVSTLLYESCHSSGDSTGRRNLPMRLRGKSRPACGTYFVGAIDLISLPTNIDNLFILL